MLPDAEVRESVGMKCDSVISLKTGAFVSNCGTIRLDNLSLPDFDTPKPSIQTSTLVEISIGENMRLLGK
jgi:hypothetical protein